MYVISSDHSAVAYLIAFEDLLFQNSLVVLCSPRFTLLYMYNFVFVFLKLILLDFIYVMYSIHLWLRLKSVNIQIFWTDC